MGYSTVEVYELFVLFSTFLDGSLGRMVGGLPAQTTAMRKEMRILML